ncbi:MAG TPA: TIGR02253 family HAD-type hydrolase [Planctomycetota bacterium]|nr:TIGR02253 family HAD-type hydrolase [Planctomycetota bacterium]
MLKAVFFDIDDTLFSTTTFAEHAREASVDAMLALGLRADRALVLRELRETVAEFSSNYEHHFDKLLSRLPLDATIGLNFPLLVSAAVVAYHETKFRELTAYDDVTEVLRLLSRSGLVLGIITSGVTLKQAEKIVRLRVHRFIDHRAIFISDQVGIGKPNPKLYQRAVERVGVRPGEAMHVGDHPVNDVDAANAAGMISVWNRREGRHRFEEGKTAPRHVIDNFWDLLDVLRGHYGVKTPEPS